MSPLWPPDEEQAAKLGLPPPCPVCGGSTYWDETWDGIFMAWCTRSTLVYSAYAYTGEGLETVHTVGKTRRRRRSSKQTKGV